MKSWFLTNKMIKLKLVYLIKSKIIEIKIKITQLIIILILIKIKIIYKIMN